MQPEQPQPTQSYQSPVQDSPKKSKKKVLLILILVLAFVAVVAGAWWYGSSQAQKQSDQEIANLQAQINDLKKESTKDSSSEEDDSFIEISQWDVKVDAAGVPAQTTYAITNILAGEEPLFGQGAQRLKWSTPATHDANKNIVEIVKSSKSSYTQPADGAVIKPAATIDGTYYYINAPSANADQWCVLDAYNVSISKTSEAEQKEFTALCNPLLTASKTIQASK